MSGPNDPIPEEAIEKVVAGPAGASATDDQAGFVDGAEAVPVDVTDPSTPKTEVMAPTPIEEGAETQLARLAEFVAEHLPPEDGDLVDRVTSYLMNKVVLPGRLGGSLLPMVCEEPDGTVGSTTVVESMSGGADELEGMPRKLSLARMVRGGQEIRADYVQC